MSNKIVSKCIHHGYTGFYVVKNKAGHNHKKCIKCERKGSLERYHKAMAKKETTYTKTVSCMTCHKELNTQGLANHLRMHDKQLIKQV